jgi:hypothetical protein
MDKSTLALMDEIEMRHGKHERRWNVLRKILEKQPAPELAALQAERDKYRTGLENIVKGDYDNAHEINAARAYAAKVLK